MKVIFTHDVRNVAKKGEIKEVSEGYALNFLFPKKWAQKATEAIVNRVQTRQLEKEKEQKSALEQLEKTAKEVSGRVITLRVKSAAGTLFGSVSAKDISAALKKEGFEVSESAIVLKKPIKTEGEHRVELAFGRGVKSFLSVIVQGL